MNKETLEKYKASVLEAYKYDLEALDLEDVEREIDTTIDEISPLEEWLEALTFYKEKLEDVDAE